MNTLILQTDIVWGQPQRNLRHLNDLIANQPKAHLIVLPEMFSTGFCTQPRDMADRQGVALSLQ